MLPTAKQQKSPAQASRYRSVFLAVKRGANAAWRFAKQPWHFLFLLICVLLFGFIALFWGLPDVRDPQTLLADETSVLLDRSGETELYSLHADINRKSVELTAISPKLILAVLAAEDDQFFQHRGYDVGGISKAVCYELADSLGLNFVETSVCPQRGGSTITQQLAKNILLTPEKTLHRKLRELFLARSIEANYDKQKILEMYLNIVPFGSDLYGAETASQAFFRKPALALTISEAAVLAAVIQRPSYFSPWDQNGLSHLNLSPDILAENKIRTFEDLQKFSSYGWQYGLMGQSVRIGTETVYLPGRTDWVLERMRDLTYISDREYEAAKKEMHALSFEQNPVSIKVPHFVMMARAELEHLFGPELAHRGGLRVYTTLDMRMQSAVENALARHLPELKKNYGVNNGAMMMMDPHSGEIKAMVGSVDFWDPEINGQVNVNLSFRSAGSTFKPIIYAANFLAGTLGPESVLSDMPTDFGGWRPQNFDGRFRGNVTVRNALGNSLNIPAVKALDLVGIDTAEALGRKLGMQFLHSADFYGLPLALGALDIRPIDLITAYSVFANEGKKVTPVTIWKVEDRFGNLLYAYKPSPDPEELIPSSIAASVTDILSDPNSRGPGWNWYLQLPDRPNAIKTGTSSRRLSGKLYPADLWTVGFTPQLAAVVWLGNTSGKPLAAAASGLMTAGTIWKDAMINAHEGLPVQEFNSNQQVLKTLQSMGESLLRPSSEAASAD